MSTMTIEIEYTKDWQKIYEWRLYPDTHQWLGIVYEENVPKDKASQARLEHIYKNASHSHRPKPLKAEE